MEKLLDPVFITALATLITSITALVALFRVQSATAAVHATLNTVDKNTNGALTSLKESVATLTATQATPAELASRRCEEPASSASIP